MKIVVLTPKSEFTGIQHNLLSSSGKVIYSDSRREYPLEELIKICSGANIRSLFSRRFFIPESEIVSSFLEHLKDVSDEYKKDEVLTRWLSISKNIAKVT